MMRLHVFHVRLAGSVWRRRRSLLFSALLLLAFGCLLASASALNKPTVTDNAPTGWNKTAVTVTLTASEPGGPGIGKTQYRLVGSSTWLDTTANKFIVAAPADHSNDGVNNYEYRALDTSGNASTTGNCTVRIDTTAPTVTSDHDADTGWSAGAVTVTLSPSDSGSGVAKTQYRLSGPSTPTWIDTIANQFIVAAPSDHSNDGVHIYRYRALDNVNTTSATGICTVSIDTAAPTVGDNAPSGWRSVAVTVTLSAADSGGSGFNKTQYRLAGSSTWLDTTANQFIVAAPADHSNDGVDKYEYRALDNAGNVGTGTCTVRIDTTTPAVTDNAPGSWKKTAVTVTLSPVDGGSGVTRTQYRLSGSGAWHDATPVQGGKYVIFTFDDMVRTLWYQNVPPAFAARGIAGTVYLVGSDVVGPDADPRELGWCQALYEQGWGFGNHTYNHTSIGIAGTTVQDVVDDAVLNDAFLASQGWERDRRDFAYPGGGTGRLTSDALTAAVQATGLFDTARGDGPFGSPTDGSGAATGMYNLNATGDSYLTVAEKKALIDRCVAANDPHTPLIFYGHNVLKPTDSLYIEQGGVLTSTQELLPDLLEVVDYAIARGCTIVTMGEWYALTHGDVTTANQFVVDAPADHSNDGVHNYEYRVLDNAGNASASSTCAVKIDTIAPTVSDDAPAGWSSSAVTVTLSPSDGSGDVSGVAKTQYRLSGPSTPTWTDTTANQFVVAAPANHSNDGVHVYCYRSFDNAGNISATGICTVRISTL